MEPVFLYDVNSPYAYIAAHRVDDVLPLRARWQPIAFGPLLVQTERVPWSRKDGEREQGMADCEERAAALGLPLRWPQGWPADTYSLAPQRAALVAEEQGRQKEFALAAFHQRLGLGRDLGDPEVLAEAAADAGLDEAAVVEGIARTDIKARLRAATDEAIAAGVIGVPTVLVGGQAFWGDDRLEDASAAC